MWLIFGEGCETPFVIFEAGDLFDRFMRLGRKVFIENCFERKAIQNTDLSVNMKGELKDHINLIKDSLSVRKSGSL